MKTCPLCSETYSERIDFCFRDGTVLVLMPSALDAPVPRLAAGPGEATSRLRTERTEESPPEPTDEMLTPAIPAKADEAPRAPRRSHDDTDGAIGEAVLAAAAVPVPQPGERIVATAPTPDPEDDGPIARPAVVPARLGPPLPPPAEPGLQDLPQIGHAPRRARGGPVLYFAAAAFGVAATLLGVWLLGSLRGGRELVLDPPAPQPGPEVAAVTAPVPPAPVEPPPAAAPVAAAPAPAPTPAAVTSTAARPTTPPPTPVRPATPATAPRTTPAPRTPATRPTTPSDSPWDAPAAVQETVATFTSDPPGALVRVDGRLRGKTPLEVELPLGLHQVELQLSGFQPYTRSIELVGGNPKYPVTLRPVVREGSVLVVAPGWDGATLYVDGAPVGSLPLQVTLAEGPHVFEVRRGSDRARESRELRLSERGLTRLTLEPK